MTEVTGTSHEDRGLAPEITYTWEVRVAGESGAVWSAAVTVTTPVFGVPGSFAASSVTATSAELGWDAVAGPEVRYVLRHRVTGEQRWKDRTVTGTGWVVAGLLPDTSYQFRVYAFRVTPAGVRYRSLATTITVRTPSS